MIDVMNRLREVLQRQMPGIAGLNMEALIRQELARDATALSVKEMNALLEVLQEPWLQLETVSGDRGRLVAAAMTKLRAAAALLELAEQDHDRSD